MWLCRANIRRIRYCTSQNCSISLFPVSLVKNIYTKVKEFIRNEVDLEFRRFGLAIDMGGISAFHFYALLYSWKLLSLGQKSRDMTEINNMQNNEENWKTTSTSTSFGIQGRHASMKKNIICNPFTN